MLTKPSTNYFAQNIKLLREKNALTLAAFAETIMVSRQQVYQWESGKKGINAENYILLVRQFKLDPYKFYFSDMRVENVFLQDDANWILSNEIRVSRIKSWLKDTQEESEDFDYLDGLDKNELKRLYIDLHQDYRSYMQASVDWQESLSKVQADLSELTERFKKRLKTK